MTEFHHGDETNEVIITRTLNAPMEAVFAAHVDAEQIPLWWGPRGLTTRVERLEVHPGGRWQFAQTDPGGTGYDFFGFFHTVAPPFRLVFTFEYRGAPGAVVLKSITLDDLGGRTRLTDRSAFLTAEDRRGALDAGMREGSTEALERLALLLSH